MCLFTEADQCVEYPTPSPASWTVPSEITLPGGAKYSFTYAQDGVAEITSITLPTGGQISYTYGPWEDGGRSVATRTVNSSGTTGAWTYTINGDDTTTVTDPNQNDTINDCSALYVGGGSCTPRLVKYYSGTGASRTLLKTETTDYTAFALGYGDTEANQILMPIRKTTAWNQSGLVTKTETDWDTVSVAGGTTTWGNPVEIRDYAFGQGAAPSTPIRRTVFAYKHLQVPAYMQANVADLATSKTVWSVNGAQQVQVAQALFGYDETALTGPTGVPGHDDTNYSLTNSIRGNQTSSTVWRNTDGAQLRTTHTYDILGNRLTTTDPLYYQTQSSYSDRPIGNCQPSSNTYAYVTQTTNALSQNAQQSYFYCNGLQYETKGPNDIANNRNGTRVTSYDALNRPLAISYPDGGSTSYSYVDAVPNTITKTVAVSAAGGQNPAVNLITTQVLDGMGRLLKSQLTSDPEGTDYTDYAYDTFGRLSSVSNPYRSGSTVYTTSYLYDPLGRVVKQTDADGSYKYSCYDGLATNGQPSSVCHPHLCTSSTSTGEWVDVADEAGNDWQRTSDSLGRLACVMEPNGSVKTPPSMETDYVYDVLNNLTTVNQFGGSYGSSGARTRSFSYDSLSELTQSNNPESGWICFGSTGTAAPTGSNCTPKYDADRNLKAKTDARGAEIDYSYDQLNRLSQKLYLAPSSPTQYYATTPQVNYYYDQGSATNNPIGHRTSMTEGPVGNLQGSSSWTYDAMGRILSITRSTVTPVSTQNAPGNPVTYTYNLAGWPNIAHFMTGTWYQFSYNGTGSLAGSSAGRPTALTYNGTSQYVSGATYSPSGQLTGMTLGAGGTIATPITITNSYNTRLQSSTLGAYIPAPPGTANGTINAQPVQWLLNHTLSYPTVPTNNGNITGDTDGNDSSATATYTYDSLNRLSTVLSNKLGDTYTYDPFGNLYAKTPLGPGFGESLSSPPPGTNNRLAVQNMQYDAAGNVAEDAAKTVYTWDAENRMASAIGFNGSFTDTFSYDADGNRVLKYSPGTSTLGSVYWYGPDESMTDETTVVLNGATARDLERNFYFDGRLIARQGFPTSFYPSYFVLSDQVGTSRATVDFRWTPPNSQYAPNTTYYYPFGTFFTTPNGDITLDQRFTGKIRDAETQNDYFSARYYTSSISRFISPDWSAQEEPIPYGRLDDPQSLNLYGYVRNNPLARFDPDGHAFSANLLPGTTSTTCWAIPKCLKERGPNNLFFRPFVKAGGPWGIIMKLLGYGKLASDDYSNGKQLLAWKRASLIFQQAQMRDQDPLFKGPQGDFDVDRANVALAGANILYYQLKFDMDNLKKRCPLCAVAGEAALPFLERDIDVKQQARNDAWTRYVDRLQTPAAPAPFHSAF